MSHLCKLVGRAASRSHRRSLLGFAFGLLCLMSAPSVRAGWTELAAVPKVGDDDVIRDISFIDDQHGWALVAGIFFDNHFYRTEDGGNTWIPLTDDPTDLTTIPRARLKMFDANTGYLMPHNSFEDPTFYRLSNNGATRTPITVPFTDEVTAFYFVDSQTGWISGNGFPTPPGRIATTINGGDNWTYQTTPALPTGTQIYDIFFVDAQHGWACGGQGVILRTEDGGTTWELARVESAAQLNAIRFADGTTGWCVGGNGTILYSNNGGVNWYPQKSGIAEPIIDLEVFTPRHVMAVAGSNLKGRVISTTNAGAVWNPENTPTEEPLTTLERNGNRVWAGGGVAISGTANKLFTRTVNPGSDTGDQPFIVARDLPGATAGVNFEFALEALNGAPPYTWIPISSLPPGIQLTGNLLSGSPQASGDFPFTIQVSDSASGTDQRVFTLKVSATALALLPSQLPHGTHRKKYEEPLDIQGGVAPLTWRVDYGALPPGMILDSKGVIAGVPFETGTYQFIVEVTDSNSLPQRANEFYSITIDPLEESGWEVLHSNNTILGVRAFSEKDALAFGAGGFLYETHSGGRVWKLRDMGWGYIGLQSWVGDKGWIYAESGLFYTEDRGATFVARDKPLGTMNKMIFKDELHGWTVGFGVGITNDGGRSWSYVPEFGLTIDMWDLQNGLLSNNGNVLKETTDGGFTWTPYVIPGFNGAGDPPGGSSDAMGALLLRGQRGWAYSNVLRNDIDRKRSIFDSVDQGSNWTRAGLSGFGYFNTIQFLDDNLTGWVSGLFNPEINWTIDGGHTWNAVSFYVGTIGMFMYDVHFFNANVGWAPVNVQGRTYYLNPNTLAITDTEGSIWGSTDGGRTYEPQYGWPIEVPRVDENSGVYTIGMFGPTITDAQFLDPLNGYALGTNPVDTAFPLQRQSRLYRTSTGGARWELVGIYPTILKNFAFRTPTSGFAVASGVGYLLETRDRGSTILDRTDISPEGTGVPPGPQLVEWMDVAFADDLVGWAIALRKTDPGDVVGKRQVIRTDDGGRTWGKVSQDPSVVAGNDWHFHVLDRMHLWRFRNQFPVVDASVDGGLTWTPRNPVGLPFPNPIKKLVFSTTENGYMLINDHSLMTTINGGMTWQGPFDLGSNRITKDLLMVNCAQGWIGGVSDQTNPDLGRATLWPSDLSGEFTTVTLSLNKYRHEVTRLAAADSNNIYAFGSFGLVMKYSGATGNMEITNANALPDARTGQPFSQLLAVIHSTGDLTWDNCGASLPPGLSINDQGEIAGTPTAAGSFRFIIAVRDEAGRIASKAFTLRVEPETGPTIDTGATLPGGDQGVDYSTDLVASGTEGPYIWTLAEGTLPPGLTLYPWGTIGGLPTTPGSFSFTLRVTDGQPTPGSTTRFFTMSVAGQFADNGPTPVDILKYLLGITNDPAGLDVNADGQIDSADVVRRLNDQN